MRASTVLVVLLLAASGARAEDDPAQAPSFHRRVVSAERLFGFAYATRSTDGTPNFSPIEESGTTVGPLVGGATTALFAVPRLAFDYFVRGRFSVGSAFTYFRTTLHPRLTRFTGPLGETSNDTLVLAPRIGFLAPLTRVLSVWPRVGFTYLLAHQTRPGLAFGTGEQHDTFGFYALTLEAPVVVRIGEHFLLTAGPTLDLGLEGATEQSIDDGPPIPNRGVTEIDVGVACGVAGDF